jgi:hypothetical protein
VYCLLGVFDIQMPLIYGERRKALTRLQREIHISSYTSSTGAVSTQLEDNKKADILMWISKIPYKDNHEAAYKSHVSGTSSWIFQDPSYISWDRDLLQHMTKFIQKFKPERKQAHSHQTCASVDILFPRSSQGRYHGCCRLSRC